MLPPCPPNENVPCRMAGLATGAPSLALSIKLSESGEWRLVSAVGYPAAGSPPEQGSRSPIRSLANASRISPVECHLVAFEGSRCGLGLEDVGRGGVRPPNASEDKNSHRRVLPQSLKRPHWRRHSSRGSGHRRTPVA